MCKTTIQCALRRASLAVLMLAVACAAQAQCKYKRLGAIPAEWVGSRLMIDGSVNHQPVRMMVDTGSVWTILSSGLARSMNLTLESANGELAGFGGKSEISLARLEELSIGRFQWHRTRAVVAWDAAKGFDDVIVGGNVLLQNDVEIDGKQIALFSPSGCDDTPLAYWADDVPWVPTEAVTDEDLRTVSTVQVNGQPVRALVDTGAPRTMLDASVARQLGFDPDDERARVGESGGFGVHTAILTSATFDTVAIGPELIRHPRIVVARLWQGIQDDYHRTGTRRYVDEQPKMILGADFVRSHHLLFATSQRRLYFSYLGGDVFKAPKPPAAEPAAASGSAPAR